MKTAVSIPDAVFRAAEQLAKRTRMSRSRLYADALVEYLTRHAPDEVTAGLNQVIDRLEPEIVDPFTTRAAKRVFERTEW